MRVSAPLDANELEVRPVVPALDRARVGAEGRSEDADGNHTDEEGDQDHVDIVPLQVVLVQIVF
jgi:hypothetical protein